MGLDLESCCFKCWKLIESPVFNVTLIVSLAGSFGSFAKEKNSLIKKCFDDFIKEWYFVDSLYILLLSLMLTKVKNVLSKMSVYLLT